MNCDVIATIQSVFMNIATGSISEMVDDSFDPDTLEFAVTAFTTLGDEIVLAVYATEEERDYARYKAGKLACLRCWQLLYHDRKEIMEVLLWKNDRNRVRQTDYDAKVKEFTQRTMFLAEDKVIPYAVFALLDSGELVNVGNFDDLDTAEISQIILDIFTEDKKAWYSMSIWKCSESKVP